MMVPLIQKQKTAGTASHWKHSPDSPQCLAMQSDYFRADSAEKTRILRALHPENRGYPKRVGPEDVSLSAYLLLSSMVYLYPVVWAMYFSGYLNEVIGGETVSTHDLFLWNIVGIYALMTMIGMLSVISC